MRMAGGGFAVTKTTGNEGGGGAMTASVILTCIMAASGGLIFGYDIGISGGVTTMAAFLEKFFPGVLRKKSWAKRDEYCVYDSQALTAFTSSLYLSGLFSSLAASRLTLAAGRRSVMLLGGAAFLTGAVVNAAAADLPLLILGRVLLGLGVGFTNQATPVYLAEIAPARYRGAFNTGFQLFIALGVLSANLTNYAVARGGGGAAPWGWRLCLGLAAAPAAVLLVGAAAVTDTPSSLVARGKLDQARQALCRVRGGGGVADVEVELAELISAVESSRRSKVGEEESPFRKLLLRRRYRHYLVMAVMIPFFQQMTGINVIAFYAPVLFQTVGFGSNAALMAAVILGSVNLGSTVVSTLVVDRYGRKVLFFQGGLQMILCQVGVAMILGIQVGSDGAAVLSRGWSAAVLVLMCAYAAAFGWSWGPLSWLIPSEIFPVEVRSAGQSVAVAVNFGTTFALAQTFLVILCRFKYGTFLFYAGWIALMTAFVAVFLPETRGVPLESMSAVWEKHWYWRRFAITTEEEEQDEAKG